VRSAAQLLTIFSACPIALRMYSFRAIELLFLLQRLADAHQSGWPYSLCKTGLGDVIAGHKKEQAAPHPCLHCCRKQHTSRIYGPGRALFLHSQGSGV
jgi:hypothetical protein